MWSTFTPEARRAVHAAQIEAERDGRLEVAPAHLLLAVLDCGAALASPDSSEATADAAPETAAARALENFGIDAQLVRLAIQSRLRAAPAPPRSANDQIRLAVAGRHALEFAADEARRAGSATIGTEHLLLGIVRARWEAMPWYFSLVWPLHEMKLLSETAALRLLRGAAPVHIVVAEVCAEFQLNLAALRLFVASPTAAPQWTAGLQRAIEAAQKEARATGAGRVSPEHLWLGLLADPGNGASSSIAAAGVDSAALQTHLRAALLSDGETAGPKVRYTPEARRALTAALRTAGSSAIETDHLLTALVAATPSGPGGRATTALQAALRECGLPPDHLQVHFRTHLSQPTPCGPAHGLDRVARIVAEELKLPPESITADTPLDDTQARALALPPIVDRCAQEFGIKFVPRDVRAVHTVGHLARMVETKIARRKAVDQRGSHTPYAIGTGGQLVMLGMPTVFYAFSSPSSGRLWPPFWSVLIFGAIFAAYQGRSGSSLLAKQQIRFYILGTACLALAIAFYNLYLLARP